jgi:hypothetical protein
MKWQSLAARKHEKKMTKDEFADRNRQLIFSLMQANNDIKSFTIHLSQNCNVVDQATNEVLDVSDSLKSIVQHMEQMNFVFNSMLNLKR